MSNINKHHKSKKNVSAFSNQGLAHAAENIMIKHSMASAMLNVSNVDRNAGLQGNKYGHSEYIVPNHEKQETI